MILDVIISGQHITLRKCGFKSRSRQLALFSVWEEYYEHGELYYAQHLFTTLDYNPVRLIKAWLYRRRIKRDGWDKKITRRYNR